jgi:hypothetical protein
MCLVHSYLVLYWFCNKIEYEEKRGDEVREEKSRKEEKRGRGEGGK